MLLKAVKLPSSLRLKTSQILHGHSSPWYSMRKRSRSSNMLMPRSNLENKQSSAMSLEHLCNRISLKSTCCFSWLNLRTTRSSVSRQLSSSAMFRAASSNNSHQQRPPLIQDFRLSDPKIQGQPATLKSPGTVALRAAILWVEVKTHRRMRLYQK